MSRLTSVELFAGGGGMALGMRRAGFEHLALVEINQNATKVLRRNAELRPHLWQRDAVIEQDVRTWFDQLVDVPNVTLVAGGPPCQPFSLAGVHAGESDERNMFPAALDVVRGLLPPLVVFENVPGLTRPSFAPYYEYVQAQLRRPTVRPNANETWAEHFDRIRRSRALPRYVVYEEHVDAADLGVPQCRRRVFLIAIRTDLACADTWPGIKMGHNRDALLYDQFVESTYWEEYDLPQPEMPERLRTHVERLKGNGRPEGARWRTVRDGLVGLPEPVDDSDTPGVSNHRGIPGARSYAKHTGSLIDWPSKAIKSGIHGVAGGEAMIRFPNHRLRYLTVREAARMQSFPDDYEFPGPRSRTMNVIGNAVAVDVARAVGTALVEHCGITAM